MIPIKRLRVLQHVPRWAIVPTIQTQTVAAHCHGVAQIYLCLCKGMGEAPTVEGLVDCICHDDSEVYTGDIPSPAKTREIWGDLVSIADTLEALWFLQQELRMGNQSVSDVSAYVHQKLRDQLASYESAGGDVALLRSVINGMGWEVRL